MLYRGYDYFFLVSQEMLEIFNEKKLICMELFFQSRNTYGVLDKVLETISKSIHLQRLSFIVEPIHEKEYWIRLNRFMEKLEKVAPTMVQPLLMSSSNALTTAASTGKYRHKEPLFKEFVERHDKIMKIMERMRNKNLLIIDAFVGVLVLGKCSMSPIHKLSVDMFRKLREFLIFR